MGNILTPYLPFCLHSCCNSQRARVPAGLTRPVLGPGTYTWDPITTTKSTRWASSRGTRVQLGRSRALGPGPGAYNVAGDLLTRKHVPGCEIVDAEEWQLGRRTSAAFASTTPLAHQKVGRLRQSSNHELAKACSRGRKATINSKMLHLCNVLFCPYVVRG